MLIVLSGLSVSPQVEQQKRTEAYIPCSVPGKGPEGDPSYIQPYDLNANFSAICSLFKYKATVSFQPICLQY